jgi:hypothetical protein
MPRRRCALLFQTGEAFLSARAAGRLKVSGRLPRTSTSLHLAASGDVSVENNAPGIPTENPAVGRSVDQSDDCGLAEVTPWTALTKTL